MSHFTELYAGGVPVLGGGGPYMTTGTTFFVDSGHASAADSSATNWGKRKDQPFATVDYAIGKCAANNGDIIFVMPGHAENISAATSWVQDVAGVRVQG